MFGELDSFVQELRVTSGRGDFADLGPVDFGDCTIADGQLAVQILLADVDHLVALTPEQLLEPDNVEHQLRVADQLMRLKLLLDTAS